MAMISDVKNVLIAKCRRRGIDVRGPDKKGKKERGNLPRAFNSCVQPRRRSWTSSGDTSVRCHASVHFGLEGPLSSTTGAFVFLGVWESLIRKTRARNGIFTLRFFDS